MKRLFLLAAFLWLIAAEAQAQVGYFVFANCDTLAAPVDGGPICTQTTTTGGRTSGHLYIRRAGAWVDVDTSGVGTGDIEGVNVGTNLSGGGTSGTVTLNVANPVVANVTGNATSATSLAGDPADCGPGLFATGIAANGDLTCSAPAGSGDITSVTAGTNLTGGGTSGDVTLNVANPVVANLTGNASTATALAANGANCAAGTAPLGIDASGVVESCFDVATQTELDAAVAALESDIGAIAGVDEAADYTWTGQHTFADTIGTLTSAGAFTPATCTAAGVHGVDTTGSGILNTCTGIGANPTPISTLGDGYTQVTGNTGSATSSGSSTLNVSGTNNVACAAADGAPDSVVCQMSITSQAQGDIIYHNGTTWVRLAAGTNGHYLQTQGAAANPQWAAASGGAPAQLHVFLPQQNEPPSANFATLDTRNSHPILLFADAVDSSAIFSGIMNRGYSGGALSVDIHFSMGGGVVTNAVGWCAQFEALVAQDTDNDGFHAVAAGLCVSATVSGTDGGLAIGTVALSTSEIDSIAAGGAFRLKIMRDGDGTNITDSAIGIAQFRMVEIRQ